MIAKVAVFFIVGRRFFFKLLLMVGVLRKLFFPRIAFLDCVLCRGGFVVGNIIVTVFSIFGNVPLG